MSDVKFYVDGYKCIRHEGSFFMESLYTVLNNNQNQEKYEFFPIDNYENVFEMIKEESFPANPNWECFTSICESLGYDYPKDLRYNDFFEDGKRMQILKKNILSITGNEKICHITPTMIRNLKSYRYYLNDDDWNSFIEKIGDAEFDTIYDSYLGEDWFDAESYVPLTKITMMSLGIHLLYDCRSDIITMKCTNSNLFTHNYRSFGVDFYGYSDVDMLIEDLKTELYSYDKGFLKTISSNANLLKKAIILLFEKNYSEPSTDETEFIEVNTDSLFKKLDRENSNTDYFISVTKDNALNTSLKELDIGTPLIPSLRMKCMVKNIKQPQLVTKHGRYFDKGDYIQFCVVYDKDTNKTIKAILNDDVSDFDKWDQISDVEIWGTFDLGLKRPLVIRDMEVIESESDYEVSLTRSQENPDYDEWRNQIIKRDEVCQCCGLDKHLEVHHLFGYKENPELATNIHNGVVLCKFCHDKYHSIYGLKDINPVDFANFIRDFGVRR